MISKQGGNIKTPCFLEECLILRYLKCPGKATLYCVSYVVGETLSMLFIVSPARYSVTCPRSHSWWVIDLALTHSLFSKDNMLLK